MLNRAEPLRRAGAGGTVRSHRDEEIVCGLGEGRHLALYPPIGGAVCDRCGARAEDVCFVVRDADGGERHGGLCGPCLAPLLE
ncbi:hypothetical protein Q5424_11595 [Conexibacter sp. JD483]|uniref:hypothetical protein n=1 Tax=unclassified Conexibacter TaxID=2627773 RepID=UPI00272351DA|nr:MULTISPECIES: hypothetical protein [unclassified Conexibacter]MDO8187947.1 hypothetical protein [Conexibacter sp. CPCC 205706]MDO8200184.1 hypothetical protein [Conexibacter sp. CPCC 205762]MDR9369730.1 hypothetical protein [Conexibacter sp. JD483]